MSAEAGISILRDGDLSERFQQLTTFLKAGEKFWRHHAFQYLQLPWEAELPELSKILRALTLSDAENLARNDKKLSDFLVLHHSLFGEIVSLCEVGGFDVRPLSDATEPRDIPGRKWQQIRHFAPCVPANEFPVLEWCAGKSHLGRQIALARNCAVTALEYNAELIDAGISLAQRSRVKLNFRCIDVMTEQAADAIEKDQNAVALHACGDLHTQLLRLCAQKRTTTITLAPCCYHLMRDESRYLLSQAAIACGLSLRRDDLRTAVQGSVTISQREYQKRQRLQAWRLGFDLLQRDVRGCNEYLETPSLPVTVLHDGFESCCRRLASARDIDLPIQFDAAHYEKAGEERLREVTALDLPRIAFRRALELWLVLDRALFLREQGYRVEVGTFCEPLLTPRNLVVRAHSATR